jgi:undecaprenyl-phosphate 4-deoxy-4-formamido-L-arabinose transferase
MQQKINLTIVIPVYNSATVLKKLAEEVFAALNKNNFFFEIIFVNDGSIDDSWKNILELCKNYQWIKAIDLRKNFGQHNAILAGLNYSDGEVIVLMDDDLQHSPKDILTIYSEIKNGKDVCYARFLERKHSFFKVLGSKLNNFFASVLIKKPFNLYFSPFKGFKNSIKNEIIKYKGSTVYIDGIILNLTSNISSVQVQHYESQRSLARSNYNFYKLIKLWSQTILGYSTIPLRIATFIGIITSLISLIMALIIIIIKINDTIIPIGWASVITSVLFIGGIQLIALGIIGEYLAKVHYTINTNVQFSVNKKINF